MRCLLLVTGEEEVSAKHVEFPLIRERPDFHSGGVELVVDDVDEPGAEERSPANSQHDMDVLRGQIMVVAVDVLDSHFFFDILSGKNRQTENITITFFIISKYTVYNT